MAKVAADRGWTQADAHARFIVRAPKACRAKLFAVNHNLRIDAPRMSHSGAGRPSTDARKTR